MEDYTKAKLVAYSQPSEEFKGQFSSIKDLVAFCARVSNPSNQMNTETSDKLITYLIEHKHFSPFEMASLTIEVETTRDIARQLLRHRSFTFQEFCIAEGSKISIVSPDNGIRLYNIEDLYLNNAYRGKYARVYDASQKTLVPAKIKEVFKTGVKPVHKLVLNNGKNITSTEDHKFLTKDGFKPLKDIKIGESIACNGIVCYQDKEWLLESKLKNIENGRGLEGIAEDAGCSYHTIRKWLKKYSLQFSKLEVASYTPIWNKGLSEELQPMFGKLVSDTTRGLMKASAKHGENCNLYKHGEERNYRQSVWDWQTKYKNSLVKKFKNKCNSCSETGIDLEIDHVVSVASDPDLSYDYDNLQLLCKPCHKAKSNNELKMLVKWTTVKSIDFVGNMETYDMEIDHIDHNYVANGIVTHNSQRYADPLESLGFVTRDARLQDTKNRQNSIVNTDNELENIWQEKQKELIHSVTDLYTWAIMNGIAKEQARSVLPEGLTMSRLYIQGTIRSFIHYIDVRTDEATQLEHRVLAEKISEAIQAVFSK
jgi:thymidylate synthase (FAD)